MARLAPIILFVLAGCGGVAPEAPQPQAGRNVPAAQVPAPAQGSMRAVDIATFKDDRNAGKVPVLFDVRTPGEYSQGHVDGAILVPLQELDQRMAEFEPHKDSEIYLICQSGARSGRAAAALTAAGYKTVNVQGGTGAWVAAGNDVVR